MTTSFLSCDRFENKGGVKMKRLKDMIFPVSLGILWGISFGVALKNIAIGISLGLVMAMVFGSAQDDE